MSDVIYDRGHRLRFVKQEAPQSLKIVMILANSVDPDEMVHYVASQIGTYCLPKQLPRVSRIQGVYK